MDNRKEGLGFLFGLLVGSLVGASVAIILAPQSGDRTREMLKDKAKDVKERASDFAHDLKEDYEVLLERGKAYYEERRGDGQDESETVESHEEAETEVEAE